MSDDVYRIYCDVGLIGIFQYKIAFSKVRDIVNPNQIISDLEDDSCWSTVELRSVTTFILRLDFNVVKRKIVLAYALPIEHWGEYESVINSIDNYISEIEDYD